MELVTLFFHLLCFTLVCSDQIDIDLSLYHPNTKYNTFISVYTLSKDQVKIDIENINEDVGFLLIQVHSFVENITLSETSKMVINSSVTGRNVGLVWDSEDSSAVMYILRKFKVESQVSIMLVITAYNEYDPVPGGCNLTSNTQIAPYQTVVHTDDYIMVHTQPPSAYKVNCDDNMVEVDMYHMFLPEYDNKNATYFEAIKNMLTVDSIRSNGRKVITLEGYFKYGRLYSNYRGTGEVFAVIATFNNRSSAYVPATSYGCDLVNWDTDCMGPVTVHWKFFCASLLLFGLFECFLGHRCFKISLFLTGLSFGILTTYLVISVEDNFTNIERATTCLVIGFFYGVVWVFMWWNFGIPLLSVHLAFLLAGILIASTFFYAGLSDIYVFTNNINFWLTFCAVIVSCLMIWTVSAIHGHIFACTLLGSYACIAALNYYVGGNLQYIIVNTFRRLTVRNFRLAVIDPPFGTIDIIHCISWIALVLFGHYVQLKCQRNRPPFPPHRNVTITNVPSEVTPLLFSDSSVDTMWCSSTH